VLPNNGAECKLLEANDLMEFAETDGGRSEPGIYISSDGSLSVLIDRAG
jgi:hypothetical protein